ncbi:MAG: hypothetical protein ACRD3I_07375 [Terriglobales bacterium]
MVIAQGNPLIGRLSDPGQHRNDLAPAEKLCAELEAEIAKLQPALAALAAEEA